MARSPQAVGATIASEALVEDLLAVRDEQEPAPVELLAQAGVVEGSHPRLAGAGRGDEEVVVVPTPAGHLHQLEQSLLEGEGTQLFGQRKDLD